MSATTVVLPGKTNINIAVIDLTSNYTPTRSREVAQPGVWAWALINAPETVTRKAKLKIMDNILNGRSPFYGVGRVTNASLVAYAEHQRTQFMQMIFGE